MTRKKKKKGEKDVRLVPGTLSVWQTTVHPGARCAHILVIDVDFAGRYFSALCSYCNPKRGPQYLSLLTLRTWLARSGKPGYLIIDPEDMS